MTIRNVSKPTPQTPAQVEIDGNVYDHGKLSNLLNQAASQPDGVKSTAELEPVQQQPPAGNV